MNAAADSSHLDPSARAQLDRSPDERLTWLLQPRWIGYTQAQTALSRLEALMRHPPTHRMPNVLLVGPTGTGRETIARNRHAARSIHRDRQRGQLERRRQ